MAIPTTAITAKEQQYLDVVKIIKAKNKRITDMEHGGLTDDEIMLSVLEVEQSILNYCQIPGVPPQLNFVWANMTVDLILFNIEMNNTPKDPLDGLDVSDLSSIKVGDTSVFIGDKYRSNLRCRMVASPIWILDEFL